MYPTYTWLVYLVYWGYNYHWSSPSHHFPGHPSHLHTHPRASLLLQLGNCWEPSSVASGLKPTPQGLGFFVFSFGKGKISTRITPSCKPVTSHFKPFVRPFVSHLFIRPFGRGTSLLRGHGSSFFWEGFCQNIANTVEIIKVKKWVPFPQWTMGTRHAPK